MLAPLYTLARWAFPHQLLQKSMEGRMGLFGIRREATVFAQVEIVGSLATVAKRVMGWVVCHPVSTVVAVEPGGVNPESNGVNDWGNSNGAVIGAGSLPDWGCD